MMTCQDQPVTRSLAASSAKTLSLAIHLAIRFWYVTLAIVLWVYWTDQSNGNPERRAEVAKFDNAKVSLTVNEVVTEPWRGTVHVTTAVVATIFNGGIARIGHVSGWCRYRTTEIEGVRQIKTPPVETSIDPGTGQRVRLEWPRLVENTTEVACTAAFRVDENDLFRRAGKPELVRPWLDACLH